MDEHSMDRDNLVTLIEDHIPIYKLRAESEQTSAFKNLIKTPIIDKAYRLDLSSEFIYETLKYFVDCGERLTQMTKTYDDIDAVTRLLEEKERDLELAARIGQSLLEQNTELLSRNDQLENDYQTANETIDKLNYELLTANELVVQLKHELSNKNGLIQMYSELENEENQPKNDAKDKTSLLVNWQTLHDKVLKLEDENQCLRREATVTCKEIELEEKKEIYLIRDCAKQLTEANLKFVNLQDELSKRSEDLITQQEEITTLLTQAVELQRTCRDLNAEKEGLEAALQLSNECQNELSTELIELKDKYDLLLRAFHELKEELKRSKSDSLRYLNYETDEDSLAPLHFIPISESLQAEIESTLESEGYGSEFSSLNTTHLNNLTLNQQNYSNQNLDCTKSCSPKSFSPDNLTDKSCDSPNSRQASSRCSNHDQSTMSQNSISTTVINKSYSIPNKLKIVKPLEGSETLGKWKKLATPHLGVILESHTGVQNRVLQGVDRDVVDYALKKESPEDGEYIRLNDGDKLKPKRSSPAKKRKDDVDMSVDRFDTSLVYTFTTTSLSQNKDTTSVTPSLATLQLATGQHLPITSISASPISFENTHSTNANKQSNGHAHKPLPITPPSSPITEEPSANLNFSSYFKMKKSNSSDKMQLGSKMKQTSSLTNFNPLGTAKSLTTLTESIAISKADDSRQVSAGLAALSNRNESGGGGILMKGNLIRNRTLSRDVVKSLLSSDPAIRQQGFNALRLDVSNKIAENNKNIYIGKINSIKTLRKGGYF